ncbi:hypothetical protein MBANPS3_007897 [Mucor bainieri]
MAAARLSAGKIVKHLIAKNGPMTTQKSLEGEGVLFKQVHRDTTASKPNWQWQFRNAENIEKYKNAL